MRKGSPAPTIPPEHQPDAFINQANPVQGQWYTILPTTTRVRLYNCAVLVMTTAETLEVEWVVDGQTYVIAIPAAGTTWYYILRDPTGAALVAATAITYPHYKAFNFPGRSFRIRVRKTTNNGNGNIIGRVIHHTW